MLRALLALNGSPRSSPPLFLMFAAKRGRFSAFFFAAVTARFPSVAWYLAPQFARAVATAQNAFLRTESAGLVEVVFRRVGEVEANQKPKVHETVKQLSKSLRKVFSVSNEEEKPLISSKDRVSSVLMSVKSIARACKKNLPSEIAVLQHTKFLSVLESLPSRKDMDAAVVQNNVSQLLNVLSPSVPS
eukprot:720017_1